MGGVLAVQNSSATTATATMEALEQLAEDFPTEIAALFKAEAAGVKSNNETSAQVLKSIATMLFPTEMSLAGGSSLPQGAPQAGKASDKADPKSDLGGLLQLASLVGLPGGPMLQLLSGTDTGKSVMDTAGKALSDITHLDPVHLVTDVGQGVLNAGKSIIDDVGKIGGGIISGIGHFFGL